MSRRGWVFAGLAAVLVVVGGGLLAAWWMRGDEGPSTATVAVTGEDGETFDGCLLLADGPGERRRGLMQVTDLEGHDGMIFEFGAEQQRAFWMRNTPMPLSIAFYDGRGGFVSSADMAPCGDRDDCPLTYSAGPAEYAVEVPQGRLESLGLVEGSRLRTGGGCEP